MLRVLLFQFFICAVVIAQPHCTEPPPIHRPLYSDCEQVIRLVEDRATYTDDPLSIASRRRGAGIRLPRSFNAVMLGNTCAVGIDMIQGSEHAGDQIRLSGVAYAAQAVLEECLSPRIWSPATHGWIIGKYGLVNVTLGRAPLTVNTIKNRTAIA